MTKREEEIERIINAHLARDGNLPSSRGVAAELGLRDDRSVRAAWDRLAGLGIVPPREGPRGRESNPGGSLLVVEEKLRSFIRKAGSADTAELDACSEFWGEHLGTISSLVDEAVRTLSRMTVDEFIRELEVKEQ